MAQASSTMLWVEWPDGEEFALDKSASARSAYPAELLTVSVSGTLRRNVLGAIAFEKNDCNFPQRSDDNRDESKNHHGKGKDKLNATSSDE